MACSAEKQPKPSKQEEEETYSYAMQLASAIVFPAVLQAVIELDVFEIINKAGPGAKLSASEIVAQFPTKNPEAAATMLDRVLRLLVSYNVLYCSLVAGVRLYSLAPVSKYYVRNQNGVSLRPFMNFHLDKALMPCWFRLKEQILEGGSAFHKVHGINFYDYLGTDSRLNEAFNIAMFSQSSIVMDKIIESYKGFDHVNQLVEVGGGLGITLSMIISKYPHIKGINLELPHVIQDAPSYPGVKHVGGDMFERIPEGDTILMKWVFIGFDDDQCLRLLRNCYNALPVDGKVLVIDTLLPEVPENSSASRETSNMEAIGLTLVVQGKLRTKQELKALAIEAGFKTINFEYCACNLYVTEFYK
uniref:PaOMT9 n=1 Tax=Phellodendron amurense TaxID=68554 RepID=UPI003D30D82D